MIPKEVLQDWEKLHWRRIIHHLKSEGIGLTRDNIDLIIERTTFRVMSKKYRNKKFENQPYCIWYDGHELRSCHPEIKDLSCLTCACPNYLTDRDGGGCKINSKKGIMYKGEVWDCSDCNHGHTPKFARRYLETHLDELRTLAESLQEDLVETT